MTNFNTAKSRTFHMRKRLDRLCVLQHTIRLYMGNTETGELDRWNPIFTGILEEINPQGRFRFGIKGRTGKPLQFNSDCVLAIRDLTEMRIIYRHPCVKNRKMHFN